MYSFHFNRLKYTLVFGLCFWIGLPSSAQFFRKKLNKQERWQKFIQKHPFNNRTFKNIDEWKSIPKRNRPDLLAEHEFLMTVDPELGKVPYERKIEANRIVDSLLGIRRRTKAAISGLNWLERGPFNIGGRTRAVMFDPNDATGKKVWAGGAGGGLWYTNDITLASPVWNKVNDLWDNIAITTIAYNPANTQEFYVGTGEGWYNADAQRGGGIWATTDGGATWALLLSTVPGAYNSASHFQYINKIVVKNDTTIFAATRGFYTNTGGILLSKNKGLTWTQVLAVSSGGGTLYDHAADIELASNGDIYCSFGVFSSPKVFKSTNAQNGQTGGWTDISTNLGVASTYRIELACAPSNSNVIYAVGQSTAAGNNDISWFKKSSDAGATWTSLSIPRLVDDGTTHFTRAQGWYDLILAVHPTRDTVVYAGGIDIHRTTNSGSTWTGLTHWYGGFSKPYLHADNHAIIFRPTNANEMLFGNDGGIHYSTNSGNISVATPSFSEKNSGYNITQFYACDMLNAKGSHIMLAGAQDNGTQQFYGPSKLARTVDVNGGDGAYCHIDQMNGGAFQTVSYVYNSISQSSDTGNNFNQIVNQTSGYFINPSDYDDIRKILYASAAANALKRVSNIGGAVTNTDLAVSINSGRVTAVKVSPYGDTVYLGTNGGRIYRLNQASTGVRTLTRLDTFTTSAGNVSSIDIGANGSQILISFSNYGVTSVWETTNAGATWRNKEGNLPDIPIRWILYNPNNRNQVLAATEVGVWSTDNFAPGTATVPVWGPSNTSLAHTRATMLQYRSSDGLVLASTHGRGLFSTDIFATDTIADFTYDISQSCTGSATVQFYDASIRPGNSWWWDFNGDGFVDATTQNPSYTYAVPGLYSVKLRINNGTDSIIKRNIILITNSTLAANTSCTVGSNSNLDNGFDIGIFRFSVGNINQISDNNDGIYSDYTCTQSTVFQPNTTYTAKISTGRANPEGAALYIDYNGNNLFDAAELAVTFPSNTAGVRTANFTTPSLSSITLNTPIRMRIISKYNGIPSNACDAGTHGQIEDYTAYMKATFWALNERLSDWKVTCSNNEITLSWKMSHQNLNTMVFIEHSKDAIQFEDLAEIQVNQSSDMKEYIYRYRDMNPYCRLRIVEEDGGVYYSKILKSNCETKAKLSVYPNPTSRIVHIDGVSQGEAVIRNSLGQKVYSFTIRNDHSVIDISKLEKGIYLLDVSTSEIQFLEKIVKY